MAATESVYIDMGRLKAFSEKMRETSPSTLDVFDERYYPPRGEPRENVLRYLLAVVALDHRLSRPGKRYEACLSDGCYHGADLLYRLAMEAYRENPAFYSPESLAELTVEEFRRHFEPPGTHVPDPEVRVMLLRDLGRKLHVLYNGSVEHLLEMSGGYIRRWPEPGLLDLLRVFRAYEDPVEKKSLLFTKFIVARGLYEPRDPWNMDVPVDNHLVRIALRTGIVRVSPDIEERIKKWEELDRETDAWIRLVVRRAYRYVAREAGINPGVLDDHLWIHGRTICLRDEEPRCSRCVFREICRAVETGVYLPEHRHYNTWYY